MLGSREHSATDTRKPIERGDDSALAAEAAASLRALTQPFVLRRTKADRALVPELPDKIEQVAWAGLTREQAALYQQVVDQLLDSAAARPVTAATAAAPHRSARTCIRAFPTCTGRATQGLTDGEIRYIIANGIQLTGMPAMPALNGQEERVSWALVTYLRSLRTATPAEAAHQQSVAEHRAVRGFTGVRALPYARSTGAGRARRWPTSCATRASIPTPSFPI